MIERLRSLFPEATVATKILRRRTVTSPSSRGASGSSAEPSIRFTTAICTSRMHCARRWISSAFFGFRPGGPRTRLARSSQRSRRLAMLDLALAGSATDEIDTIDIERSGPSYTADTLEILAECVSAARLFFLMGEDSLRDLPTWHDQSDCCVSPNWRSPPAGSRRRSQVVARQFPRCRARTPGADGRDRDLVVRDPATRAREPIDPRTRAPGCRGIHPRPRALHATAR